VSFGWNRQRSGDSHQQFSFCGPRLCPEDQPQRVEAENRLIHCVDVLRLVETTQPRSGQNENCWIRMRSASMRLDSAKDCLKVARHA